MVHILLLIVAALLITTSSVVTKEPVLANFTKQKSCEDFWKFNEVVNVPVSYEEQTIPIRFKVVCKDKKK